MRFQGSFEDGRPVIQCSTPFTVSSFFISTEQGKVLKVLHTSEGVFIISQYSLFHNEGPVLNMAIDSQKVLKIGSGRRRFQLHSCFHHK